MALHRTVKGRDLAIKQSAPDKQLDLILVLIVDDDQAVREALKFALELDGLKVDTCGSGAELLRHPCLESAACLVLDYQMPKMDGFAVLEELKSRGIKLPVILITSPVSKEIVRRANEAGVDAILEKPLLEDVLLKKIRTLI
jgi:two-component system response regulator FixJ